jgi:hypothetical protein
MLRPGVLLFFLGATVGSALDAFHTQSGTTAYAHVIGLGMAWWTPPLFGVAGLSTGLSYPLFERVSGKEVSPPATWSRALAGFALFVALYCASGYLPASNGIKLGVLVVGTAGLLATLARTPAAAALAVAAAVVGPVVEIVLVGRGAFRHLQPDVLGIPLWLPALYAAGSVAFGVVGKKVTGAIRS